VNKYEMAIKKVFPFFKCDRDHMGFIINNVPYDLKRYSSTENQAWEKLYNEMQDRLEIPNSNDKKDLEYLKKLKSDLDNCNPPNFFYNQFSHLSSNLFRKFGHRLAKTTLILIKEEIQRIEKKI